MSKSDNLFAVPLAYFDKQHKVDEFNSQTPVIDSFLRYNAHSSDNEGLTSTTLIINGQDDVVGFFTLNMATQEIVSSNDHSSHQNPYVNLAYLAVDYRHCSKGYGKRTVKYIFRKLIPTFLLISFSYLYVDALSESVDFYKKLGFKMDSKTEKTYEIQGTKVRTYEMMIKVDEILNCI